jgi:hypothetical protein
LVGAHNGGLVSIDLVEFSPEGIGFWIPQLLQPALVVRDGDQGYSALVALTGQEEISHVNKQFPKIWPRKLGDDGASAALK